MNRTEVEQVGLPESRGLSVARERVRGFYSAWWAFPVVTLESFCVSLYLQGFSDAMHAKDRSQPPLGFGIAGAGNATTKEDETT